MKPLPTISAIPGSGRAFSILDAGCGEGFYLKRLKESLAQTPEDRHPSITTESTSRNLRSARPRSATETMDWFVASIVDLPFAPSSLDVVLNVFSPADFAEFSRVLAKDRQAGDREPRPQTPERPAGDHLSGCQGACAIGKGRTGQRAFFSFRGNEDQLSARADRAAARSWTFWQ